MSTLAPSKAPEKISGMFNRIARTYDLLNDCMTGGMHRHWKSVACKALQLQPGMHALDVCTGTGDLANRLSGIVGASGHVTALDFAEEMLSIARQRFNHTENITWVQGDAMALPFEAGHFDGAIISFGLRNVADIRQTLGEMARVVKPGGWVINLDTASDCNNPLFWIYFSVVMPLLGKLLARDKDAYQYLCRSTQTFASPDEIKAILTDLGLASTSVTRMGMGSVAMIAGQKPA